MTVYEMTDAHRAAVQCAISGFIRRRNMMRRPDVAIYAERYQETRAQYAQLVEGMTQEEREFVAWKARDDAARWGIIGKAAA